MGTNEWILCPMLTEKKMVLKLMPQRQTHAQGEKKQRVGVFRFIGLALHRFCQTESLIIDRYVPFRDLVLQCILLLLN